MKSCLRIFATALLLWGLQAQAQWADPARHWRTLESAHFTLHFAEEYRTQAHVVAEVAETVYPRITGWLNWKPESRTQLVVLDSADFANGFSTPLPFDNFAIFLSPPDEGELLQNRAWLEMVLTHEFTHIVHLDKASRAPLALRRIFGRFPWLFPNVWEPGWLVEGLAVYSESDAAKRYGRLGQSQFEAMMRAENSRGFLSLRELNADGRGFPLNRDYLYGSYFFAFLAERYGPQSILNYVENYSDNVLPFRIHSNPVAVTGKPMDALWLEYQDWLRARFAAAPADSGVRPDEGGEIIARAWSLTTPVLTREGERWYVQADGYTRPKLMRQAKGGEVESVRELESGARLAASAGAGMLVAQPEMCKNYNYFYDLYQRAADGDWNRLTYCGRFRFAAPLDDGRIVALRVATGDGEVVVLDRQGAVLRTLYRTAPGEMLTGLAVRDGTVVLTGLRDGRWSLVEIADGKPSVLLEDEAVKHSPRFGDSPDEIYFVADYGKVYNVWSWRRDRRQLSRWTQALNGVREISAPVGGEMLLTTIEADGDVLRRHRMADSPLERRDATPPTGPSTGALAAGETPAAAADDPLRGSDRPPGPDRPYSPWSSLMPRSWFPMLDLAQGAVALGVQTFGQDALGLHNYTVAPMYEFTQKEALGSVAYDYDGRHGVLFDRKMTVKASTQTGSGQNSKVEITDYTIKESAQWVSTWRSVSLNTRYYWGLGGALDQESFHEVGVGTLSSHDERVLALVAGVDTRRWQWLSEGPSQGQQLRLFAETSNGLHGAYSGNVYRSDWRGHFPFGKTVVSLRWNEVYAQADAEAVQLGGTASEETFALPVLNQREFPLRGYSSGESVLTGHRARLGTIEWRIPLADVDRHFMLPPAGLNRVSMNVFVDSGAAWEDGAPQHYYRGVGFELLSEIRLGYLLGLQARAGVAKGLDGPGKTMGYLRVGRSF